MTRLNSPLLVSLLLHLAVIFSAAGLLRREVFRVEPSASMVVEYLETGVDTERQRGAATLSQVAPLPPVATTGRQTAAAPPSAGGTSAATLRLPLKGFLPGAPADAPAAAPPATAMRGAGVGAAPAGAGETKAGGAATGLAAVAGPPRGGTSGPAVKGGGAAPAASESPARLREAYLTLLKNLVKAHQKYPAALRRLGREGSCQRRFVLGRGGYLKRVESISSCGHPFLDDAATLAITSVGTFPPLPEEYKGGEATFTIPISFTFEGR